VSGEAFSAKGREATIGSDDATATSSCGYGRPMNANSDTRQYAPFASLGRGRSSTAARMSRTAAPRAGFSLLLVTVC
jgi:hypothetical protein